MSITINGIMKNWKSNGASFFASVEFTIPSWAFGRGERGGDISFTPEEAFFTAADLIRSNPPFRSSPPPSPRGP